MDKKVFLFLLLAAIMVVGCAKAPTGSLTQGQLDFFKSYSSALTDIHTAYGYYYSASASFDAGDTYSTVDNYDYETLMNFWDDTRDEAAIAQDYLTDATTKLNKIKSSSPDDFFSQDIEYRLQQAEYLSTTCDELGQMAENLEYEVYEVNYGTEEAAQEYFDTYNELVTSYNEGLTSLSEVEKIIDSYWKADWYPDLVVEETS